MTMYRLEMKPYVEREDKIKFIIRQERLAGNLWKWIEEADDETVNDLYDYWTQEIA